MVFGQSLLFGLLSITTHEWVFPATRNTHSHTHTQTQHTLSHIIRRDTNVCVSHIYHYHCEWLQRYPTFCFVWARVIRKFLCGTRVRVSTVAAQLKLEPPRWKPNESRNPAPNWTQQLNECGASKQSIWKIQLYARNSSIRTTFFFYLFSGH